VLDPARLQVTSLPGAGREDPLTPRRCTLTHSDLTGHLFLSIGEDFDEAALRTLQVRLQRDEVLGEWVVDDGPRLDLHMAAQGGLPVFGTARMRVGVFRRYRDLVLDALRSGDSAPSAAHPEVRDAPVMAHFHWRRRREEREDWGRWGS
jgi:hypothetical protein